MTRVIIEYYNDIALQGTTQPLFNHVTKMVHESEPANTIKAVRFTLSTSVTNVGRKFYIHEAMCAC